jgi:prepilin-type N-terminal cleavage/methylation domain-containing protein
MTLRRPNLSSQHGFTLIEVMASTSATAVVIAAATAFLLKFLGWYDELSSRIAINRHARETYEVLSLGARSTSNGNDGTKNVYGIRERFAKPSGSQRSNYAFSYTSNNITLTPDTVASMTIACVSTKNPLPDCGSGNKTVTGWIGSNMTLSTSSHSVSGKTVEVTFTVMNPFQVQRAVGPALFAENYHAVFTFNREEDDP